MLGSSRNSQRLEGGGLDKTGGHDSLDDGLNHPDKRPEVGGVQTEFSLCVLHG